MSLQGALAKTTVAEKCSGTRTAAFQLTREAQATISRGMDRWMKPLWEKRSRNAVIPVLKGGWRKGSQNQWSEVKRVQEPGEFPREGDNSKAWKPAHWIWHLRFSW